MGVFKRSRLSRSYSEGMRVEERHRSASTTMTMPGNGKGSEAQFLQSLKGITMIGEGSFGKVLLVEQKETKAPFALKIQSKEFLVKRKLEGMIENEVELLSSVDHPLINTLQSTFEDSRNVYMLLEYVPGGDMFTLISNHGEEFGNSAHVFYAACMLISLQALHEQNIIYRDIKPENVLIDAQGYTRLVDFGFAKRLVGRTYTPCGTPDYFSPELIGGRGYGKGNDVWGMGVFVYELMCSYNPFARAGEEPRQTLRNILRDPLRFHPLQKNALAKSFLASVLEKNVMDRGGCGVKGIGELRTHPWFAEVNWADLREKRIKAPWVPHLGDKFDTGYFDSFDSKAGMPLGLSS